MYYINLTQYNHPFGSIIVEYQMTGCLFTQAQPTYNMPQKPGR